MAASETLDTLKPETVEQIQTCLKSPGRLLVCGGGSKPALSGAQPGLTVMDLSHLAGVVEYQPEEFTVTVLAGTKVADLAQTLRQNDQYLPFDPLLSAGGATLGGTVASGLSGSGRYRFGGVRDFLLGVRFVDGNGDLVRGGSKVVKNAAGFDLPKLLTGSLGSLGILFELTFKVFPLPEASATVCLECGSLADALQAVQCAPALRIDLAALDVLPGEHGCKVLLRVVGIKQALPLRLERLAAGLGSCRVLEEGEEAVTWHAAQEFTWVPPGWSLVKVPLTPGRIPAFDAALQPLTVLRRYICGGQAAWVALQGDPRLLEPVLKIQGLNGLVLFGPPGIVQLGELPGRAFLQRVKRVLDPAGRFVEV